MSAATYNQLVQDVYTITARIDRAAETALAIRRATLKYHLADLWKNDIANAIVTLPVIPVGSDLSFRYTLDLTNTATYPLIRKVSNIVEYNAIRTGTEYKFDEYDNDNIMDDYRVERLNYWYQMARQATLRCDKILNQIQVQYWAFPNVTPAGYNSWIADQNPDFISCEAAAYVFAAVGKSDESARFAQMFLGPNGNDGNLSLLTISEI